jgi:hypothetical protein
MRIIAKSYHHYFTFTARAMFVEYGEPSIASHGYWYIPGPWGDET